MKYKKNVALNLLTVFVVASCNKQVIVPKEVTVTTVQLGSSLTIHTEEQKELIESSDPAQLIDSHSASYGVRSISAPLGISFSWSEINDINQKANDYTLTISENSNLSNPLTYVTSEMSYTVKNLKINTKYYYSVSSNHSGHLFSSDVKEFTINDDAPRNLDIEGVENCRDLGGWDIGENKVFKQGLIYRTAQFNYGGANTFKSEPTENGKNTLLNDLKIKTDIDLRRTQKDNGYDEVNGITSSPLGNKVNYVSAPMLFGGLNIFTQEENINSIKLFFETLADESNYPIAFHCSRGTDRTGALAYVIGALVGMSEEDLMLDYLFSDLAKINGTVKASSINGEDYYVYGISHSEGSTYSEKARNYLKTTVGVSDETLNSVISILTD